MAITNKRLKQYINSNTTSIIRERAKDCKVTALNFNVNGNDFEANVNGSSGIPYIVTFSGLLKTPIKSNCSCPFDHGNVCKHEVAVAIETEAYFSEKVIEIEEEKEEPIVLPKLEKTTTKTIKYSTTAPIVIIRNNNEDADTLIRLNASATVYRESHFVESQTSTNRIDHNYIHLHVLKNNYWGSRDFFDVIVKKQDDKLSLLCNCRASNKLLCKHQAQALQYIEECAPVFFYSETEIEKIKEEALNEYGFSLKDENYKKYFTLGLKQDGVQITPKIEGINRLSKYEDLKHISNYFSNEITITQDVIPIVKKKKEKEKLFGLAFLFGEIGEYHNIQILPIRGNSNKEKTDMVSKIEEINSESILLNSKNYISDKQHKISKQTFIINTLDTYKNGEDTTFEKREFIELKKLLELIDEDVLLYELNEDYYQDKILRRMLNPIKVSTEIPRLFFKIVEEDDFYTLKAFIQISKSKYQISKSINTANYKNIYFFKFKNIYYKYPSLAETKTFLTFFNKPEIRILKSDFENFNQQFIEPISSRYEVINNIKKYKKKDPVEASIKKQLYLSELEDVIILKPVVEYQEKQIPLKSLQKAIVTENDVAFEINRNTTLEKEYLALLENLHPSFSSQDEQFFYIDNENFISDLWFLNAFDILKENNVDVYGYKNLTKAKYNLNKPSINVNTTSGIDWFDVEIEITFGDQLVNLKDIRKSIINKENYIQLKDGSIGILPQEWVDKYSAAFRSGDVKKDAIGISKYQLSVIDSLYDSLDATSEIVIKHKQIKNRLSTFKEIENVSKPKGLKATLRDYQKEGLNWLNFLEDYNFGGCLADDMGLGKTLQVISFLKHLKNTKKPKCATLIILPTSLIFNWQEEVKKFAPTLKYIVHTGNKRDKNTEKFDAVDLVFTTYGLIMRDINFLKDYTFHYCILDESQAIKNPNSQRYKAVRLLKANNKLVLTGTPIENNTFDLYAQMSFVNPGLLGTMANFKKEYATPIDKNKDTAAANDLRQLINPFMLRRTKEQVATELPKKTEQVLYCTMDKEQQKLYDAYKNKYRDYLLNKIDEDGIGKSKMYVLEGLTKLRQICDSPQLLNDDEKYTDESIKIKELINHISEKTGSHKILVFSQFVKMLSLVKTALDKENITYEYLDGKTKDRQAKVDNFQNNDEVRVFLISLKAGGTGLNLTAADYVYLVDPWWNPAVEAQAIDRCYRIGQTKKVMAYKMICKGTVEEKIINYQEHKKQLSSDIIQTDESFVKNLSKESIAELFS